MLADPEGAQGGPADVYSLAKTLWVLIARSEFPPPGTHSRDVPALRPSSFVQHPRVAFLDRLMEQATRHEPSGRPTAPDFARELRLIVVGSAMPPVSDGPDLGMLREELLMAAERSQHSDSLRNERLAAGRALIARLVEAGAATHDLLANAGAPLASDRFGENARVLERANNRVSRNPEAWHGRCLVSSLRYETGLAGPNRLAEVHLWSGFGVVTEAEGTAVVIAAHIAGEVIVWSDCRHVPMGSMAAEEAVSELATGLRDHAAEGLAALLVTYKRAGEICG